MRAGAAEKISIDHAYVTATGTEGLLLLDGDGPRAITLSGARRLFRSLLSCFASTADQLARKKQKFGLGRKETLMVVTSRSPCWSRFPQRQVSLWLLSKEQGYSYGYFLHGY